MTAPDLLLKSHTTLFSPFMLGSMEANFLTTAAQTAERDMLQRRVQCSIFALQ